MTWLFSPIKSTDTNPGILGENRTHHGKAVPKIASRLGDKCDRSMTRGKLLENNPTLFIFISLTYEKHNL